MASDFRLVLDQLGADVECAWGPAGRYDLEIRSGLLLELEAARERAGAEVWAETVAAVLAGPRPRVVATAILVALRRRAAARPVAREVTTTAFIVTTTPAPELTRYHQRLLALLGSCAPPAKVQ